MFGKHNFQTCKYIKSSDSWKDLLPELLILHLRLRMRIVANVLVAVFFFSFGWEGHN